ncbi:MAG: UDP-N-acetylmuramoyl-L-alanine--D-glutamate ligase [Deltaproteobacteria bacterium]|nr:UDP-N-acetylmuramoyl-L-alanine--D-glutamate ligase [Deltaproteobacteria bacterium]
MKLTELRDKSVLLLGLGQEGLATFHFLRERFPHQRIGFADREALDQLHPHIAAVIRADPYVLPHLGDPELAAFAEYDVLVQSPGIPSSHPAIQQASELGTAITSHTALFFANCPSTIVGITGTKGKSTTAGLIHAVLAAGGLDTHLVGNMGNPSLNFLPQARADTIFVYELSSYQLEGLRQSPHIAVFLNIFPEHLDYHGGFAEYVEAKQNICRYQSERDYVVYNAASHVLRGLVADAPTQRMPFSLESVLSPGCCVADGHIFCDFPQGSRERIMQAEEVPLLGTFNLQNVLAAVAVGKILGVPREAIAEAVRAFQPLEHRFEHVGAYQGITFYNASIATVPQATIEHLNALGDDVQTVLLGGYDRHLDFSALGKRLVESQVKTLILFPTTGERIWEAVRRQAGTHAMRFQPFFVRDMEEAVRLAYRHTEAGNICLHSPASPSFGLFKDYRERGTLFKRYVEQVGQADGERKDDEVS